MKTQHFRHPKRKQNPLIYPELKKIAQVGMVSGLTLTLGVASIIKAEPTFAQGSATVARRNPGLDPPIVQRLEKTLGKPLTPQQRQQVVQAATQTVRQLLAVQEQIAEQIAAITGDRKSVV